MIRKIAEMFGQDGYRFCKARPEEVGIYYKFYQEGFHVCLLIDWHNGFQMTPETHDKIEENIMNLFYHPQGKLEGFPTGLPVYHVEVMTILVGNCTDDMHVLCANCKNTWAVLQSEQKLLIYENQPGDFFGLRSRLEQCIYSKPTKSTENGHQTLKSYISNWRQLPYFTIALVAVNIIVFLIMEIVGSTTDVSFVAQYGAMFPPFVLAGGQWWRILTAMFIHFGIAHLLNNMVILACIGSRLERAAGHVKFMFIYFLSGIGGGLLSFYMMIRENSFAVSAGASGAIFGLMGGMIWVVIRHRGRYEGLTGRGLIFMAVLCLYYGFTSTGVDNWCHIGGILTGFVLTALFYRIKVQKD